MTLLDTVSQVDWQFGASNEDDDFHTDVVFLRVSVRDIDRVAGISHERALLSYKRYRGDFYYSRSRTKRICEHVIGKLFADPAWGRWLVAETLRRSDALSTVFDANWPGADDWAGFCELYRRQLDAHISLYQVCWIPEILQADEFGLTAYLESYLEDLLGSSVEAQRAFVALTTDVRAEGGIREDQELLRLAEAVDRAKSLRDRFSQPLRYLRLEIPAWLRNKLELLSKEYGYLSYHGYGNRQPRSGDGYLAVLQDLVLDPEKRKVLVDARSNRRELGRENRRISRTLPIDPAHKRLFALEARFATVKLRRRLAQLRNFYYLDRLIGVFANRLSVPEAAVRFMLPEEILHHVGTGLRVPDSIDRRSTGMLYYIDRDAEHISTTHAALAFGENLRTPRTATDHPCLRGRSACPGYAEGRAVVAHRPEDALRHQFRRGDILVTTEGDTDLIEFLYMAGGLVTDQGGITCHLASIARDIGVPTVTGTVSATDWVLTGEYLAVNASCGEVRKLRPPRRAAPIGLRRTKGGTL